MWSSKELDLSFLDLSMNYYTFINFSLFKELKKKKRKPLKTETLQMEP